MSRATQRHRILSGAILWTLLSVTWPIIVSGHLETLVRLISTFWLGRRGGTPGLTTDALMGPVIAVAGWLMSCIPVGTGSLISRSVGSNDGEGMDILASASLLACLVGGLFMLLGLAILYPGAHFLSGHLGLEPQVRQYAFPFLLVMPILTLAAVQLQTISSTGWTAFAVVRVFADLALIAGLTPLLMPVFGVGGPNVAYGLSSILLVLTMTPLLRRRGEELGLGKRHPHHRRFSPHLWRRIIGIGLLPQLGRAAHFIFQILLVQIVVRDGKASTAGYWLALTLLMLLAVITFALACGNGIIIGQNVGAGQPERALKSLRMSLILTAGTTLVFGFLVPLARPIAALFTTDPAVIAAAMHTLKIIRWGFLFLGTWQVLMEAFVAVGHSKLASGGLVLGDVIGIMVAFAWPGSGLVTAAVAFVVSNGVKAAVLVLLLRRSLLAPLYSAIQNRSSRELLLIASAAPTEPTQ